MTGKEPSPDGRSTVVVVCSTIIALAVLGLYAWQSAHGKDTGTTLTLVMLTLAAAVPGWANYNRTSAIERKVDTVQAQTNGNVTRLHNMLDEALGRLAESVPPRPPVVIPPEVVRVEAPEDRPPDHS
jgi:ammonia channel protein AmtB